MNKSFDYYCEIGRLRNFARYVWEKNKQNIWFLPNGDFFRCVDGEKSQKKKTPPPPFSMELHPAPPQDANRHKWRLMLGFSTKKKWFMSSWWCQVVTGRKFWVIYQLDPSYTQFLYLFGGFLKWWYPTTMGFPTKNDHFGVFWGYHHFSSIQGNTHFCRNMFSPRVKRPPKFGETMALSSM